MKIFAKIFLSHIVIGFFSVILFSFIFYFILRNALIQRTIDQLSSINILKRDQIDNYFSRTEKNLTFWARRDLLLQHPDIWQKTSVAENDRLKIRDEINDIRDLYGFKDITITDAEETQLISTSADSVHDEKMHLQIPACVNDFCMFDASDPRASKETMLLYYIRFASADKKQTRYMIVRDDFQKIQKLLQETTGMGATGESYLVGNDLKMRSSSRFFLNRAPLTIEVRTKAAINSFGHQASEHVITDYRGTKVLSFYRTLNTPGIKWALISEIDFDEAMRPIIELRNYLVVITFFIVVFIILITLFISNAISRPILYLRNVIISLSQGIIPKQDARVASQDEIGQITEAVNQLIQGMKRTTQFAYEIGSGNFHASFTSLSESDTLGLALMHMRDQLRGMNDREIKLVREKAAAMLEGQENERKRIIQELHDGVGQLLTAVRLRVEMLDSDEALRKEIMTLINETIAEVKRISYNVMPNAIVDFGLEAALRGLCENIKKYTSLAFDFQYVKEADRKLSFDITIAVFRIVQEGLNNIVKHANAVHVVLHVLEKEDEVYVMLRDDGIGFEGHEVVSKNGMGLRSMKERAKLLHGNMDVHTHLGKGTIVEMHIPITEVNG